MTIIQQPDTLSLSQNLKPFVLQSETAVLFTLKKGEQTLLMQRYEASHARTIEIDVKDIIHDSLHFALKAGNDIYEQTDLAADFTAQVEDQQIAFRVLRGGVDRIADTCTNILTQNFLTWQPTEKKVTYYSPEYLTYYAAVDCEVKLKAYLPDAEAKIISLGKLTAGKVYTIPLQYAAVVGKLEGAMPGAYDVWTEDGTSQRLSYVQRYRAEASKSLHEDWILFENSLGGLDCFRAYGVQSMSAKHVHNVAELAEETEEYRVDTERLYTKETGYLTKEEGRWLLDFFPSLVKYVFDGNSVRRITVTESEADRDNDFEPCGYKFTYKYSSATPLLNLPRREQPAEVLNIEIPQVGNFTLPPRLAEVERLPLSEGVLFPVQHPYSENWGTTTIGSIAVVIGQILENIGGSGGGIGHKHLNIDLLNALELAGKYLTVYGKKISAGHADTADELIGGDERYLRKDVIDSTKNLLRLLGGAEVGEAVDSMLAGKGTILTADGRGQFNRLEVRDSMVIMDLIVNQLQGMENDFVFAPTRKVTGVVPVDEHTYRLLLEPRYDGDVIPFREGNIIYSIINDVLTGGKNASSSYMRVLAVNQNTYSVTAVLYPDSEVPGGKNCPPAAGYNISRRGDVTLPAEGQSNPDAQSWYLSSSEGRLLFLQNVVKPVLEDYNYALSVGKFPDIPSLKGIVSPDKVGIMSETIVAQELLHYDYNGDIVPNIVYRGNWSLQVATSAKPYRNVTVKSTTPSGDRITKLEQHTVTHLGCVWGCLVDKTTDEPKWNAQGWQLMEGDTNYSMTFESSEGFTFFRGNVNTQIDVVLWYGNMDITADVKLLAGVEVEWLRDSGNVPADNSWRPQYADDSKLSIRLSNADVTPNFGLSIRKVKFVCNCYIPIGKDKIEKVSQEIGFKF